MDMKKALAVPYVQFGKTAAYGGLHILASLLFLLAIGADAVSGIALPSGLTAPVQIILFLLSLLCMMIVIGSIGTYAKSVEEKKWILPPVFHRKNITTGLRLFFVLIISEFIYQLTTYIPSGSLLTYAYVLLLIVFLPAIVVTVAVDDSVASGFKIVRKVCTVKYVKVLGMSLAVMMTYSVGALLMTLIPTGEDVLLSSAVSFLQFAVYVLLVVIAAVTAVGFIAQGEGTRGATRKLFKQTQIS